MVLAISQFTYLQMTRRIVGNELGRRSEVSNSGAGEEVEGSNSGAGEEVGNKQ